MISPLGTRITLANRVGGSGDNFTSTTFDNTSALPIASGSAPFSGTFKPSGSLGALFGADANGTWTLEIQDVVTATNGLLNAWSLAITSGDPATLTNSSGAYQFIGLPAGTFTTREVVQAAYTQTSPSGGFYSTTVSGTNVIAGLNFGNQPQPSATPGSVTLLSASDTGVSNSDLITRLNNAGPGNALQFSVASTIAGATITILSNGTPIGSATAGGTTTVVTTNGFITLADGAHDITARQTEPGKAQSASTAPLAIQVDTQAPVLSLVPVSPDPRTAPVSQMTIAFDEWITGLELGDLALKFNGGVNLLSGAQSVASGDGTTWTLGDLTAITTAAGAYQLLVTPAGAPITDRAGNVNTFVGSTSFTVQPAANSTVLDRRLFYNQSAFDDGTAAISLLDKNAIATDKSAYLPDAGIATFSSVSSYSRGINGIIIDISGSHPSISPADFVFKVGNNNSPASWAVAPTPSALAVLAGEGAGGSDRVEITWASGSIKNQWLEVQVLATANTGLAATDVFFWGNKIADSGSGSPANLFQTDSTDAAQVFATLTPAGGASITNPRDYNRSGAVDSTDAAIVFNSLGTITRIDVSSGSLQGGGGGGSDGSLDGGGAQPATSLTTPPAPTALLPATTPTAQSTPGGSRAIAFGPWSDRASASELPASFGPHELGGLASLANTAHWWQSAEGGSSAAEFDAFDEDLFELLATGRHIGAWRR